MKAAVLTVSDRVSRGEAEDGSGDALEELLRGASYDVVRRVVPDERAAIAAAIRELAADAQIVLTTGGTGLAKRAGIATVTGARCGRRAGRGRGRGAARARGSRRGSRRSSPGG